METTNALDDIQSLRDSLQREHLARRRAETLLEEESRKLRDATERLQTQYAQLEHAHHRLKSAQAQLLQSEKMASIGQLAAGVAHEINNPVGFVKSNLGTMVEYTRTFKQLFALYDELIERVADQGDWEDVRARIEAVREEEDLDYILEDIDDLLTESTEGAERVKDIVQNLKSFARLDEAELKEFDINEGIQSTLKVVWNELKYKCVVHKRLGVLPYVACNPGQLNQVFLNLLVNAAQAIDERGEIIIETFATESDVAVKISDTGHGILAEHLPKLFTPFFTTKPVGGGTGLGLSISYNIVKDHGGAIDVDSEPGVGTTFTVRLPRRSDPRLSLRESTS